MIPRDLSLQVPKFVKSTKTDEEEDKEIERQGGPIDNRPLYDRLEEQKKKVILNLSYLIFGIVYSGKRQVGRRA